MKKITLFIALLLTASVFAQFPESFDTEIPETWEVFIGENGLGTSGTWYHNESGYAVVSWDSDTGGGIAENWLVSPKVSVLETASILTFFTADYYATDYGSEMTIRVSTTSQVNISDFTVLKTIDELDITTAATFESFSVDLSDYIGSEVYIAFVMSNDDGDAWFLDDIDLVANASAPNPVTDLLPANGAVDVAIDTSDGDDDDTDPDNTVTFSWVPALDGDSATGYEVYLGDSATSLNLLGTATSSAVNIFGMEYSTTYYWSVVATNVGGSAIGSVVSSFTTESDPSLSLEDNKLFGLEVFPIPTKDVLTINSQELPTKVSIFNLLGKEVLTFKETEIKDNTVNISALSKGVYMMKITINESIKTLKIIKE
ncbi:choice-of-anchor J domain-containing protein [Polaribacter sp. Asnod1-A03]|uniref:T9SS type A sorting domain-containing protein n=1 Tax=Polaribacter sp. Asnod1-A03 TaxID=3160581 RepID=UPI003862EA0F